MNGITSYKDLKYWDQIHPKRNQDIYDSYPAASYNDAPLTSLLVVGSPRMSSCSNTFSQGCYIMLLGNLNYETEALKIVLDNYVYLNSRTNNVRFFMPGFTVGAKGLISLQGIPSQEIPHKDMFEFYPDKFIETINWLQEGNPNYQYSDYMEMIILPYQKLYDTTYDFKAMLHYNLDALLKDNININQFIYKTVEIVSGKYSWQEIKAKMEREISHMRPITEHKVFIAGSKSLGRERDGVRSAFAILSANGRTRFLTKTYEDFERSFTDGGRQQDYNNFIKNEADSVVFILNDSIGGITLDEFNVALSEFKRSGRPKIYVYNKKSDESIINSDIQNIRDEINNYRQYYIDYTDVETLKLQVRVDFIDIH